MTVIKAVDIMLREWGPDPPADEVRAALATLAPFRDGGIFAGRLSGDTTVLSATPQPTEHTRTADPRGAA